MQADFSVELGADAPALEIPWDSNDLYVRYYDLKKHPELVQKIPEAAAYPELGAFLSRINAAEFPLATAKCDAWPSNEIASDEEIFGDRKVVSYVDLVFVDEMEQRSFEKHEAFAKELCRLLSHAPEIAATVELVIRHCYYHRRAASSQEIGNVELEPMPHGEVPNSSISGFCLTAYVTGFGDIDHDPLRRWAIALNLLQHAIVQSNSPSHPRR
jgi:hypothetical protein